MLRLLNKTMERILTLAHWQLLTAVLHMSAVAETSHTDVPMTCLTQGQVGKRPHRRLFGQECSRLGHDNERDAGSQVRRRASCLHCISAPGWPRFGCEGPRAAQGDLVRAEFPPTCILRSGAISSSGACTTAHAAIRTGKDAALPMNTSLSNTFAMGPPERLSSRVGECLTG